METKEIKKATETSANANTNKAANNNLRPSIPAKEAKNEPAKNEKSAQTAEAASAAGAETKAGNSPAENQQSANPAQPAQAQAVTASQAEPSKKTLKERIIQQAVRSLDQTVNLVLALSTKIKQRDKYRYNIETLNAFKINQVEEDEDSGNTSFQRCELTITDDQGNEYTTKNPLVIAATVEFMTGRFMERLAEIEAEIIIPEMLANAA